MSRSTAAPATGRDPQLPRPPTRQCLARVGQRLLHAGYIQVSVQLDRSGDQHRMRSVEYGEQVGHGGDALLGLDAVCASS